MPDEVSMYASGGSSGVAVVSGLCDTATIDCLMEKNYSFMYIIPIIKAFAQYAKLRKRKSLNRDRLWRKTGGANISTVHWSATIVIFSFSQPSSTQLVHLRIAHIHISNNLLIETEHTIDETLHLIAPLTPSLVIVISSHGNMIVTTTMQFRQYCLLTTTVG